MAIEQGIVIGLANGGGPTAWVETVRSNACESCASRESCNAGSAAIRKVEALNEVGARIGDRIQLSMSTAALLKATFLLYLFPILCMLAGAFIGNSLAGPLAASSSKTSLAGALLALIGALVIVRIGGNKLARKAAYKPKIIRVLGAGPLPAADKDTSTTCSSRGSNGS